MHSALVSFYRTVVRHKLHTALDIGGLALGIAVFLTLALYVRFETSFERWLPHHEQIYVVGTEVHLPGSAINGVYPATMGGLLEQMQAAFPGLTGTRMRGGTGGGVVRDGVTTKEDVTQVDASFFDVFALPMVAGQGAGALRDPAAVLISRAVAARYFGHDDPIGQTLTIALDAPVRYHVAGVFEDIPANSDLKAGLLIPMPSLPPPGEWAWNKWGTASLTTYLRFPTPAAAAAFAAKLPPFVDARARPDVGPGASKWLSLPLMPLRDVHLHPVGAESASRRMMVAVLGAIGLMTLAIAVFNHVNLATARGILRAREVALRKVTGATRATLIRQFVGEAVLMVGLAALVGLALAEVGLPLVNAAAGTSLTVPYGWALPLLVLLTGVVGFLAGFYPAIVQSTYPAAAALSAAPAPAGGRGKRRLREALIVLQFTLAIIFAIGTLLMMGEVAHLRGSDLGFQRRGLITVASLSDKGLEPDQVRSVVSAIRRLPGVNSIGLATAGPGGDGSSIADAIETPGQSNGGPILQLVSVGPGFFDTYGARLLAGRVFDGRHPGDDSSNWKRWNAGRMIVLSRQAAQTLGFATPGDAIGRTVGYPRPRTIVGVIEDMRFLSTHQPDGGSYYIFYPDQPPQPVAAVRFRGDPRAMLDRIASVWRREAPQVPFRGDTVDARIASLYEVDTRAMRLFTIGAVLALVIACIGLYGLAAFDTARRVREIGIRKTLGASTTEMLRMLVGQFLRPVVVATVLAWPIAFYAMRQWLAAFADRIALSPLYFLGAGAAALVIAAATVFAQSWRVARAEPARALRYE